MDKTLRKTICYTETLSDNGTSIASLRGTINVNKIGGYTINCTALNKELFEANKAEIETEQTEFTKMIQEESDSQNETDTTVTSETAPVTTTTTKKTSTKTTTAKKSK